MFTRRASPRRTDSALGFRRLVADIITDVAEERDCWIVGGGLVVCGGYCVEGAKGLKWFELFWGLESPAFGRVTLVACAEISYKAQRLGTAWKGCE